MKVVFPTPPFLLEMPIAFGSSVLSALVVIIFLGTVIPPLLRRLYTSTLDLTFSMSTVYVYVYFIILLVEIGERSC